MGFIYFTPSPEAWILFLVYGTVATCSTKALGISENLLGLNGNSQTVTRPGKLSRRRLEISACDPPRKTEPQEDGNFGLRGSIRAGFTDLPADLQLL